MKRKWIGAAAALLLAFPAGLGVSGASTGKEGPRTQPFAGVVRVVHDTSFDKVTECTGVDGEYSELRTHVTGTMVSTDKRVSGAASIEVWLLRNVTTLLGTIETAFEIRDPGSGAVKWSGSFIGVIEGASLKGVMVGTLADGTRVVANMSGYHPPKVPNVNMRKHNEILEFGGPAAFPIDGAILQRGSCSGATGLERKNTDRA